MFLQIRFEFRAIFWTEFARFEMKSFNPVIHSEEEENAGEQIKPKRVHITHATSCDKFICQTPRFHDQQRDRCKELRVPVQKRIENIDNYVAERPPVIDRRLPALSAPPPRQLRPAVLAMRQRRPLSIFAPAEKASAGRSLN